MAATQTEKQQNDVNSEKVQSDQHLNVRNSLLQNGTDKSGVRGGGSVVHTKAKSTAGKNIAIEMSQYRQDGSGGSTAQTNSGPGPTSAGATEPGLGGDTEPSVGGSAAATDSSIYSAEGSPAPPPAAADGHVYSFPYGRDVHNSAEGGMHAFGPRQPFGAPKQMPPQPHQRFVTGPSMSQPPGPTPTLNQLLQSTNTMPHRYPNSYGHPDHYNQAWPSQKPIQQGYAPGPTPGGAPPASSYRTQPTLSPAYGGGSAPSPGFGESRSSWPSGPPGPGSHGPGSPGQASSSAPVSQPSPQPSQPPSHSPGPGPGMPPSPQHQPHQGFPSRPAPPTTPNAHAPDAADLSGGNSNDSSGGPAPGTPNSQSMRPTPSPTGSTGSRSMSPAVVAGQNIPMPPRPSSGQSEGNGPSRISHSPMGSQSSYPAPHSSPHPAHGYKGHPSMVVSGSVNQQMPLYQPNQYPQTGYPPRPPSNVQYPGQAYGPPSSQPPPPNNMPPQQFPSRSAPNHLQNSQFPPYQQSWQASISQSSKGNGPNPPTQTPGSQSPGPTTRPPHYLKHHLQHKMGFQNVPGSAPPSPSPPQNYHMGPPSGHHHSGMGPPSTMGPPNMPPASSPLLPNNHPHDAPMPPPSSTPNSHTQMVSDMMDNGITTTAQGGLNTHVTAAAGGSVTSVVTTGPDGTPIDEGSQQSTLSNASAASGEDPQCTTPKASRKNDMGSHYSHPTTPQSTAPSPGAPMNSMHEDYGEIGSPSWQRTPASPKSDNLSKLYEMDDNPDRKAWLDKLLAFMDDRRTPITTCPTISKNPLDLFRLYMFVKDRGGFMEVTNSKTWKDIAGMLGIGASSSAAYTLRKHYTKNLLAYECQFDRGGIDPQPIINKVEATSKKKNAKATSVPSPGSSNSQDSFPPGSGGASMDGYSGYGGYPPTGNADYPPQRPSSQSAPSPHGSAGGTNHLNSAAPGGPSPAGGASDNVNVSNPFDDVSPSPPPRGGPFAVGSHPPYPGGAPPRPPGQNYSGQPGYQYPGPGPGSAAPPDQYSPYPNSSGYPPAVRPVYPPYSSDSSAPPPNSSNAQGPPVSSSQDPYRYNANPGSGYSPRPAYGQAPSSTGPPPTSQPAGPGNYPPHPDYYRPEQVQQGAGSGSGYAGGPNTNKTMPPPGPQPPRRHPDFAKDQPYSYGQPRTPMYGGWPNNNQYRAPQYGGTPGGPQGTPPQWNQSGRPGGPWAGNQGYQQPQPGQPPWPGMAQPVGQNSNIRPTHRPGKPFPNIMQAGGAKGNQAQPAAGNTYSHNQMPKREITFPPDSVEATVPVLYRRKRICRNDVGQVDAWRIIMCLRSGLLSESTYALDMLNVLLFDDSSVSYFGLSQWPGLLDLLMEHFKRSLSDMFDGPHEGKSDESEIDLGGVITPIDPELKTVMLNNTTNYSLLSRKGHPVKLIDRPEDIFIQDNVRDWDIRGDPNIANITAEIPSDPCHTNADHILPPFQAEFERISFHMRLKEDIPIKTEEAVIEEEVEVKVKSPPPDDVPPPNETPPPAKSSEKRRRTKTLSDVISRIKKDSEANDVLTLDSTDKVKTEIVSEKANCEEQPSIDLKVSVNGECSETKEQTVQDPSGTLKRRRISDYEDEAYSRDEASLVLLTESQDNIGKRCICLSNILRSLTFVPGNEIEFARSGTFLALIGKLLLLHHEHPPRTQKTRNYDREEDADFADSCSSLQGESEWWWDFLIQIRENILVSISNIAGQIDVSVFEEEVARPLLDGLLHWAICPSATGQDPFASVGPTSLLSPQRLALEALCKICVTNSNVDLVIATPPFPRLERLCAVLTKHLCRSEDQVLREFSINLLHYLAAADSSMSRVVASQTPCVSLLVAFIEQAEQSAMSVANQHGISALRENPDSMGTSLDMLRRAAATLVFLARHPDNKALLVQQESRLLALVMSQILDQQVALLLSKVLFQISRS
nr:trithorax group protein osa isoform X3 [Leptinotarsa decemlineata]